MERELRETSDCRLKTTEGFKLILLTKKPITPIILSLEAIMHHGCLLNATKTSSSNNPISSTTAIANFNLKGLNPISFTSSIISLN
ncbi:hypothetical protein I3760_02G085300 [Carya illinoinensis]|uniref:Uncharacterized protein n=1 Tax=Carya illinoinensis TaxID=32201 RepID=A0A8T1RBM1_CARIL|nr:hypothetical protein I3760_02G085300 [Carya illinoinensis]KAG6664317.1 hypothetical protein CIPAW_02G084600 [Carya illinoinensis]KAG6726509.1 hypothetical protein I3842_02G083600 [Carya illinoinensis]